MIKNVFNKLRNVGENDKIVYKNVLIAFLVKGGALFVTLFTLPAYIRFFKNEEVLGIWYTILSLLNWILNFDLGMGNGLRNHLSSSLSIDNKEDVKKYISSAYFSIGIIVVLFAVVFIVVAKFINFNTVLSIHSSIVSGKSLYKAIVIAFIGVMLQFWLKLINSILYALQKSSINNFLVLCTNVIILLVAWIYPSGNNDTNVIVMAIVHAIAVALPLLIASLAVFLGKLKYAIPRICFVSKKHIKGVLSLGGAFFFVQIAYMLIMSTNEFLITKTSGSAFVVNYQAYYKLFSLGSTMFALALTPIWSVITKAKAENNYQWIYATYKRFMILAVFFCVCEFLLIAFMKIIMNIWLGQDTPADLNAFTGFLFALLGCGMVINSVLSSIANGLGELKIQAICFIIGAIAKIPLAYLLTSLLGSWNGVVISNVICIGIYCIIQPIYFRKNRMLSKRNLSEENIKD